MRLHLPLAIAMLCAACAHEGRTAPAIAPPLVSEAASESELRTGKRVYELHCSRCHGRDGKDDTYPFIATLDGIGERMTPAQILEATWASGFASPNQFTEDEKRALGLYVFRL